MDPTRAGGEGVGPRLRSDQLAAQAHRHHQDTPTRWVRVFDTITYADAVINVAFVVRIVQAPGATLVQAVMADGSFVEVSAGSRDHQRLMDAIGQMEVATR